MAKPVHIPFQQLLDALLDVDTPFKPRYLHRLSDLERPELKNLQSVWTKLPLWRRQALMEDVEELSGKDTMLDFVALSCLTLQDDDPKVRLLAVHTLWEYEETRLIPYFLKLLSSDEDAEVRAASAGALSPYVFAGELDQIPVETLHTLENNLLAVVNGDDVPIVRQAALEAMGYSSRDEVLPLIESAYASNDKSWIASALFAMGRSANLRWQPQIMTMLKSSLPSLRFQAARAAGELEISSALPDLMELLDDPDDNTRLASIWSLSQIGGEGVREILEKMVDEAEDDEDIDYLESALENLSFDESLPFLSLFDFPEDPSQNLDHYDLDDSHELFDDDQETVD